MDLDEIKEFWKARPIFHDEYGVIEATEWLIAEVERLNGNLSEWCNRWKEAKLLKEEAAAERDQWESTATNLLTRAERAEAERDRYKAQSEERRNMLEDVVNELDLSDGMIEEHGPLGTAPAALVRLVLDQKDREIAMLKAGMKPIAAEAVRP